MIRISYYEVWSDAESAAVFLQSVCYYHETRASEVSGSESRAQIGNILGNIPAGAANHTC
eukprot:6635936-Pyramimonas_sp.AAC.1